MTTLQPLTIVPCIWDKTIGMYDCRRQITKNFSCSPREVQLIIRPTACDWLPAPSSVRSRGTRRSTIRDGCGVM